MKKMFIKELEQLGIKLSVLTEHNNSTEAYLEIARFLDEPEYVKKLEEIKKRRDNVGYVQDIELLYTIYRELMDMGFDRFGNDEWNKYVYSNT